jgi:2-methylisocitrate lyase-like PEP mutase family enzyme
MSTRKRFRELLAGPEMILAPGAYDALSAKIIEQQGFKAAVAGGYAACGSLLSQPDTGQSNMRDYADHYGRIAAAINIPLFVDADTGFGGVNNVRQMVRAFEAAGVAGLFIGDQVFPNRCGYMEGKQVVPAEEMLAKVKAALDARRDPQLIIAARTDAFAVDGLNAGIERAQMFMEIGADMAMVMGSDKIENFRRVKAEVPGPRLANMSHANPQGWPTLAEYEAAGANFISFPSATLFAAVGAVTRVLRTLQADRSFDAVARELAPLPDYYELVGLKAQTSKETEYLAAAKAAVNAVRKRQPM